MQSSGFYMTFETVQDFLPALVLHLGRILRFCIEGGRHPRAGSCRFEGCSRLAAVSHCQGERLSRVDLFMGFLAVENQP